MRGGSFRGDTKWDFIIIPLDDDTDVIRWNGNSPDGRDEILFKSGAPIMLATKKEVRRIVSECANWEEE